MARLLFFVLSVIVLIPVAVSAQEVPLASCNKLSMVKVTVEGRPFQFLLDTGAASTMLNLKSFSSQSSAEITMESWNGTVAAPGREVVLHDLTIGEHAVGNLKLLAVDLTPLERSCQRRVDGVLGADLIEKLGLTIDLKNHVLVFEADPKTREIRFNELSQQQAACEEAFNRSDEKAFEKCLDPEIVLLTSGGDYHGRKAVMKYLRENFFVQDPPVRISFTPRARRAIGTVIWMEYDISVTFCGHVVQVPGTALYQKTGERWLMSNMNYAAPDPGK